MPTTAAAAEYTGPLADATFRVTIPGPKAASSGRRRPAYVSSATQSIRFAINSSTQPNFSGATLTNFNARPGNHFDTGTLPTATCPAAGSDFVCTFKIELPPGTDNVTLTTYDSTGGAGTILSQQIQSLSVVAGAANSFNVTMDANLGTMTVSGTGACTTGPVGASFGSAGMSPVSFTVAYTDPATKTVVGPGLPKLAIQGNDTLYHTNAGTINGTGGTVGFTIDQAAQTFVLTPSNSSTTNAGVNVNATPANTNGVSDGLGFTNTKSFTFSTGPAPPNSFLAVIEQLGANSGRIDLFTVVLGGSGAADTFSAYTVSGGGTSLAVTNSTNENKPDVDNPRDILFDSGGNLLIANGGQGGALVNGVADYGDFACVPSGAIATGSTTTTTNSANARDPESIAIGTDNSVAMANVPASAAYNVVEYLLGTAYTAAPVSRDIANPGGGQAVGGTAVVALPTLTAGTFAAAITSGTTISRVVIKAPSGSETNITDAAMVDPTSLGWDAVNSQLVIGTHDGLASRLLFYTVSPIAQVKTMLARDDGTGNSYLFADKLAVSPDGHVAVAGGTADGPAEVQVYDNTPARNAVGASIPFDSYTNSGCTTGNFGNVTVVYAMRWLSNSKLLIALRANGAGKQGVYIFDVSTLMATPGLYRYNANLGTCNAVSGNSPKQTGFQATTNPPLGAAFKP